MAEKGVDLDITDETKEKLRCSICEGYLMCSPIRLLPNGNNICGRCSSSYKATTSYRNNVLEAILKDAVFPCKFQHKGCSKRLNFVSDSDHESSCKYSTTDILMKTSGSTTEQDDIVPDNSRDNVFVVPKPGSASITKASVCTDDGAGTSNWQANSHNTSAPPSRAQSASNYDTGRQRSSSVASNRSQPANWNGRHSSNYRTRPYPNYVNRNNWQSPWMGDQRQPRHINMYKRRNNLIIIKGGTFYVNW